MLFLAFFDQMALNPSDIDHHSGPDEHLMQTNQASDRHFVVIEWSFESPYGCFDCGTQVSVTLTIGTQELAAECAVEIGLAETQTSRAIGLASCVV